MFSKHTLLTLAAGILAGVIFAASAYGSAGGLLLIYLPCFPLLLLGFTFGAPRLRSACLAAIITVTLFTDTGNTFFFATLTVLPTFYFIHKALLCRDEAEGREWYPVLNILAELSALAAVFFLMFSITATLGGHNGLQALVASELASDLGGPSSPEFQSVMKWLMGEGSFLLFASTGWSWVLMLYAFAVLAHNLLKPQGLALRPDLTVRPGGLPLWLLGLLCLNGVLALIGQGNNRFTAETVFLLLLLPYFLAGLAQIHVFSLRWQNRRVWLTLFYLLLLFQAWLIAFVAATGLYSQLAETLDKRRRIG